MGISVRIFVVALIVIFTAGTAVQMSAASAMSAKMAHADISGMNMDGCKDCPDAGKTTSSCASICVMPLLILPALCELTAFFTRFDHHGSAEPSVSGHSGPPDPDPPRSIILS